MDDSTSSEEKTAEEKAISFKDKGNELVREKKLADALIAYSSAITLVPTNELFWSNRSMVYYQLGDGANALADAERCIEINSKWGRGYSRKVNALQLLGRHEDIIETCRRGLAIERSDALVKNLTYACLEQLEGKFWGTTSEAQGAYVQELEFSKEGAVLKVRFFGQEIVCTYRIDPTQSPMTMIIGMPQQPPMQHIFRFTKKGLDLVSPSLPSGANPTVFEGDGFIALTRGAQPEEHEDPLFHDLTLLEKLGLYVEEAIKIVPNKIEDDQPDAFLKIIHFQKNFFQLRARFGPEVAEFMTKLLQEGDLSHDVPEPLVRRVCVLREKMQKAHLIEDPIGTEGEDADDASVSTTTSGRTIVDSISPEVVSSGHSVPAESKRPETSCFRAEQISPAHGDRPSRFSPNVKILCSLVIAGGAVALVLKYFPWGKSEQTDRPKS